MIKEMVELPLRHPGLFKAIGVKVPYAPINTNHVYLCPCRFGFYPVMTQCVLCGSLSPPEGSCCMAPQAQGRPWWPGLWPMKLVPSSSSSTVRLFFLCSYRDMEERPIKVLKITKNTEINRVTGL